MSSLTETTSEHFVICCRRKTGVTSCLDRAHRLSCGGFCRKAAVHSTAVMVTEIIDDPLLFLLSVFHDSYMKLINFDCVQLAAVSSWR